MIGLPATVAPDTILRLAIPADAEAISALVRRRSSALGYGTDEEFEAWFERGYSADAVRRRFEQPEMTCLVVTEHNELIGYAHVNLQTSELGGLHVARNGDGIGTLLGAALIEIARTAGLQQALLTVASHNDRMVELVIRNGFTFHSLSPDNPPAFASTEMHRYAMQLTPADQPDKKDTP